MRTETANKIQTTTKRNDKATKNNLDDIHFVFLPPNQSGRYYLNIAIVKT